MTANQFYVPDVGGAGDRLRLEGDEHRHLARAARVRSGETVWLFDGSGRRARARVEKVGRDETEVVVIAAEDAEPEPVRIVLAVALVPSRTMEQIVEKAAELGVSEIRPLVTARSLREADAGGPGKRERWLRIAREAVKQSKGARLPEIAAPVPVPAFLRDRETSERRFFLDEHGGELLGRLVAAGDAGGPAARALVAAVGPEGGWTEAEAEAFRAAGFTGVSLGRRILRAETAAMAAAVLISHFAGG